MWNRIRDWFGSEDGRRSGSKSKAPTIPWVPAEQNPWGIAVLDVRPVTHTMLASSTDPQMARNAISYGQEDGTSFIDQVPAVEGRVACALRYRRHLLLSDGPLFVPTTMEHKWAIFHNAGLIRCVRGWTRQVQVTARVEQGGEHATVVEIAGSFTPGGEDPTLTVRTMDYLLRSHALDLPFPVPLRAGQEADPYQAALWCMSMFGSKAVVASPHVVSAALPDRPLRSVSQLHIAVARGDGEAVRRHLAAGIPIELQASEGLTPLHWALSRSDTAMMEVLIESGAQVDGRSAEGSTPLMSAVQSSTPAQVEYLLARGADANAQDERGFTALHRAAEMGKVSLVRILLAHGARADIDAQGHTAKSLARARNELEIVALLG